MPSPHQPPGYAARAVLILLKSRPGLGPSASIILAWLGPNTSDDASLADLVEGSLGAARRGGKRLARCESAGDTAAASLTAAAILAKSAPSIETASPEDPAAEASRRLPWPLPCASWDLFSGLCWQTTPTTRRPRLGAPSRVESARLGVDSALIAMVVRGTRAADSVRGLTPCAASG